MMTNHLKTRGVLFMIKKEIKINTNNSYYNYIIDHIQMINVNYNLLTIITMLLFAHINDDDSIFK